MCGGSRSMATDINTRDAADIGYGNHGIQEWVW